MKKTLKILICVLLTVALSIPLVVTASAASAKATISLSASKVYTDKQVKVTVTYKADTYIGAWDFTLNYDPSLLQYVSGADKHTLGSCRVVNVNMGTDKNQSVSFTLVFNTLAEGDVEFTTSTKSLVAEDSAKISPTEASAILKITKEPVYVPSGVNTLSELSVEEGKLSPAFAAGTSEYTLTVDYPVKKLTVNAPATHKLATVSIKGEEALEVGENTVTITVKAENGSKNTYTIRVTRNESPYTAEKANIDGIEYTFPIDESTISVPDGFTISKAKFNGKDVLAFKNLTGLITIVALDKPAPDGEEGEKETVWFVYHEDKEEFEPYISYSPGAMSYVILTPPEGFTPPEGYYEEHASIGNKNIIAYKNSLFDERFSLIYAAPVNGEAGIYVYDSLDNTLQFYMTYDGQPTKKTVDDLNAKIESIIEEKDGIINSITDEKNALSKDKELYGIIILACLAVILLLIIILIIVAVKKSKKRNRDYDDYDEFEDETRLNEIFTEEVPVISDPIIAQDAKPEQILDNSPFDEEPLVLPSRGLEEIARELVEEPQHVHDIPEKKVSAPSTARPPRRRKPTRAILPEDRNR
ncbi:MAG: cadherin-like beta sandwich domain-containing protein, partial [Clostridia bacterium]|nr:cadherin-like beta sandwich domain-containing protein [Clostridia bacterium]